MNEFSQLFWSKEVVKRGLKVAIIVGIALNLINQGDEICIGHFDQINWIKFGLTFIVPYLVSTYSSAQAKRDAINN